MIPLNEVWIFKTRVSLLLAPSGVCIDGMEVEGRCTGEGKECKKSQIFIVGRLKPPWVQFLENWYDVWFSVHVHTRSLGIIIGGSKDLQVYSFEMTYYLQAISPPSYLHKKATPINRLWARRIDNCAPINNLLHPTFTDVRVLSYKAGMFFEIPIEVDWWFNPSKFAVVILVCSELKIRRKPKTRRSCEGEMS